ncbi:DUF368 domain-containing protein [Weissella diestrammenae]|uniref:DUF368 domain-containing protein n=1 Tax=Weissella diestrammenae TaxID=1162633 RepID=A0A7G9T6D4_9LACO|nr:DUF368 domain-containing protein [Weissella diestrammenae]MCM0583294.1 DUF368 domain-containing protein [Weissella diestrammenae]QNN75659.1 DUF368 domain-containing protein [Weissella diestrammenae]
MKSETIKNWFVRFVKGVFIALGFILPGVSGGVLAAILGLYERMLNFMAHLRSRFKVDFWFFLPVGIGGLVGIILLSAPLEYLLSTYKAMVLWAFAGAIVGTLPALVHEAGKKGRSTSDWLILATTMGVGGLFLYNLTMIFGQLPHNYFSWLLAGGLIALGVIVPGLSPSNLLLYLGLFDAMLIGFKNADLNVLIPVAFGGILTLLIFSKIMHYLLQVYYAKIYHFILGIVLVSTILILLPPVADYAGFTWVQVIISGLLFVLGTLLGYWMSGLEQKYK